MVYLFYIFFFVLSLQTRWIIKAGELAGGFFEYGTISLFVVEVVGLAIVGWWLVRKFVILERSDRIHVDSIGRLRATSRMTKLRCLTLFLFFTWLFISLLWNPQPLVAAVWIARLGLACAVGAIFISEIKKRGHKFLWNNLGWFVFGIVLQASLGIYQFLSQSTFANKWLGLAFHDPVQGGTFVVETVLRRWLRAYGGLPHPNVLAAFIIVALIIVVARYVWRKELTSHMSYVICQLKEIAWLLAFIVLTTGLVLTFSRGAWVAGGVVLVVGWGMVLKWTSPTQPPPSVEEGGNKNFSPLRAGGRQRGGTGELSRLTLLTLITLSITIMLVITYRDPFTARLSGQGRLEVRSLSERQQQLSEGWQLFLKKPIQGWGITAYTQALFDANIKQLGTMIWDYQPVHFVWLTILVELGGVGVLLFLLIFIFAVLSLFRHPEPGRGISGSSQAVLRCHPAPGCGIHNVVGVDSRLRGNDDFEQSRFIILSLLLTTFIQTLTDHFWWTLPAGVWLLFLVIVLNYLCITPLEVD